MTLNLSGNSLTNTSEAEVFVFPTSFAQQRLWFLNQLAPKNPFYNVSTALRLIGALDFSALEQTFNQIVDRHETLRTTFAVVDGQPVQVIAPTLTIPLNLVSLSPLPSTEREKAAQKLAIQEAKRPFDLSTPPLLRVTLLQLDEAEYILLLNLHHIVADGWSIGVLVQEISTIYTKLVSGDNADILPELPIQYADFTEWQHQYLETIGANGKSLLETQLAYWQQQLDGISSLNLPTDKPRPPVSTYQGACQKFTLSKHLTEALEQLSQEQGVTMFMTLLAAFQTLLYRYTEQEDIAVGSPIANRNRQEIEQLIGFFVNSLILRTNLGGNPTFLELLARVKQVTLQAYAHQDLPFEKLVEQIHPERDLSRNPLFQVSFSLQNTPVAALKLPDLSLSLLEFDTSTAKLDLEFHLWQDEESLKGQIIYSTDLFNNSTINRMIGHWQSLLVGIVTNPKQHIHQLPILTDSEFQQLLCNFNQFKAYINHSKTAKYFYQLFEAQAEQTPEAIAVVFEDQKLTYRELNIKANQLAHYLRSLGVGAEVLVSISIEPCLEIIIGFLAILKAGGVYLPLDPSYPEDRLQFMLEDAQVKFLITKQEITKNLPKLNIFVQQKLNFIIYLDQDWQIISKQSQSNLNININPENLAYVIYTSGSTGKPKGVLIEHQGLNNLIKAQIEVFNIQRNDRILQFASLSFDAAIFEIVMALSTGATLYLARKAALLGKGLIQILRDQAITHVTLPPAVLAILPAEPLPSLKTIIAAGESCSTEIVKSWGNGRRFFNAYGPTEATVWSTIAEVTNSKISIGHPIINTQVYILDSHLQPVPIGIPGEMYIGGLGVARGYLNRPQLTAQNFIPNPFSSNPSRLYKTGDRARYLPNGEIEFLGRLDQQVKIRGFRVELGEIAAVLRQHPAVKEAVAIAGEDKLGNKRLIAYIVPTSTNLKSSDFRQFLQNKLPDYMVPSAFVILDEIPLTPNGKIDHRALSLLNSKSRDSEKSFVAPSHAIEVAIAKIYTEVLNLETVSINDSFFDLGGNSLLAIRLVDQLQKEFKQELPLSQLFLNPTVAGLANYLNLGQESLSWSPLVAIQPNGSQPPFFCVHPIFGAIFPYYELATHLGKERPFYGIQPLGLDGKSSPFTCIEDMAAYYIQALQRVQPKGPYFLGGWSFGGLVAFEMAQQLLRAGEQVALLAILDTKAPIAVNKPSIWQGLKFLFATVGRYIWSFLWDYFYLLASLNKDRSSNPIKNIIQAFQTNFADNSILGKAALASLIPEEAKRRILSELAIRPMLRVYQTNSQATLNYVPKIYPNKITLFRTSENGNAQDLTLGWSELTNSEVETQIIPGNHLTMLKKPHVQILAQKLNHVLDYK